MVARSGVASRAEEDALGHYRFVTMFRLDAPREAVHRTVLDPRPWAQDVTDVLDVVMLEPGDEDGVGRSLRASVRAPLGYRLGATLVTTAVTPDRIALSATGDLVGQGIWELTAPTVGTTEARFTWDVRSEVTWMNLLEPVARPVFVRSHHVVMRRACRAAARHLGVELRDFRSEEVSVSGSGAG